MPSILFDEEVLSILATFNNVSKESFFVSNKYDCLPLYSWILLIKLIILLLDIMLLYSFNRLNVLKLHHSPFICINIPQNDAISNMFDANKIT